MAKYVTDKELQEALEDAQRGSMGHGFLPHTFSLEDLDEIAESDIDTEELPERKVPKSLQELWVENGCKFPFKARKIVDTSSLSITKTSLPVGAELTFTTNLGADSAGDITYRNTEWTRTVSTIKAWEFAE